MPTWLQAEEAQIEEYGVSSSRDNPGLRCSELADIMSEMADEFPDNLEGSSRLREMSHDLYERRAELDLDIQCDCPEVVLAEPSSDESSDSDDESHLGQDSDRDTRPISRHGSESSKNSMDEYISSDSGSDEEPVGGAFIVTHCPHIGDNPERCVYTIQTLLRLFPCGKYPETAERLGLRKVVFRYDMQMSNRAVKRLANRHRFSVKNQPRHRVVLEVPVEEPRPPFGGKPVRIVRKVIAGKPLQRFRTADSLFFKEKHFRNGKYPVWEDGQLVLKHEGRRRPKAYVYRYPRNVPNKNQSKYWYFLRKRGMYYLSMHNPVH